MGQPAARLGDMTSHAGSIVAGYPTVLIGGMPAARLSDMHVCPLVTPAGPATIPHVGMPVVKGSTGVMIGKLPAARMGDMAPCVGPPDSIVLGCMTVLIGEAGGGGGGGGGAGAPGAGSGSAATGAITSASIAGQEPQAEETEGHYLDVKVVDKANKPVAGIHYTLTDPGGWVSGGVLGGELKRTGVTEGSYELTLKAVASASWSKNEAKVGDKVKLTAEVLGVESGEDATLIVSIRDSGYADHVLEVITTTVKNGKIEADWTLEVDDKLLGICDNKSSRGGYSSPFFFYTVVAGGLSGRSGILRYKDWVELELKDDEGKALGNREYAVYLPTGEIKTGTLDGAGKARVDNVPPGGFEVAYDLSPDE